MPVAASILLASILSSVLGLTGAFLLLWQQHWIERWAKMMISFAAGAMLAAVFYDIIPEALANCGNKLPVMFGWLLGGFVLFFTIEKYLHWHDHSVDQPHSPTEMPRLSKLLIIGDAIHNAIDGIVIATTFLIDPRLGVATSMAVFFHEIPRELGDVSVMIATGMKRRSVIIWNVLGALVSPVAALITVAFAGSIQSVHIPLLGLAAGSFVYIAASDLVPQVNHERRLGPTLLQVGIMIIGVMVIVWTGKLFPGG